MSPDAVAMVQLTHVVFCEVAKGGVTIVAGGEAGVEGLYIAQKI